MERKKTALSRFFDVIDGVENAVLAVMVVGHDIHDPGARSSGVSSDILSLDRGDQQVLSSVMMFVALAAGFNQAESSRVTLFVAKDPNGLESSAKYYMR